MSKEKTPYDRSNGVKRMHMPGSKAMDATGALIPVIAFEFEKTSAIKGRKGNHVFLSPEAAITLGEQLIAAGKGETPNE